MSHGILMFAHNNGLFNYGKMAFASSLAAKENIGCGASLITDQDTWATLEAEYPKAQYQFQQVIFSEPTETQIRRFDMSDGSMKGADYFNMTRMNAYDMSPYDETLLIDTDVLVLDDALKNIWGSRAPVRVNTGISEMVKYSGNPFTQRLSEGGLDILWATITYFRRCPTAETFFRLASYVIDNFYYYGLLYGFPTNMYRVDYAMTIAAHIMNSYIDGSKVVVDDLPNPATLFAWGKDVLMDVNADGSALFIADDRGNRIPVRVNQTVHCMNKDSMMMHADRIIDLYA